LLYVHSPLYKRGERGDFSGCHIRKSPLPPFGKGG
jgi:hypothetical protein